MKCLELYTENEMDVVEKYIEKAFGEFDNILHEVTSTDIHIDICIIPPSKNQDYYKLVTMGMGAHKMNTLNQFTEYELERAELSIALPSYWKIDEESMKDNHWYWPIGLLKMLARLPITNDTWLGFGHSISNNESHFSKDTELCAAILIDSNNIANNYDICILPNGEKVNFYQIIPLYENELEYKLKYGVYSLLEKMDNISFIINPTRQNIIN